MLEQRARTHAHVCCFIIMLTAVAVVLLLQVCPYYGSRRAVPGADVVLAPYNAVLMPDARDSLGIELQDSVLVFDEAHNLLDALNSAHSTTVTGKTQGSNQHVATNWCTDSAVGRDSSMNGCTGCSRHLCQHMGMLASSHTMPSCAMSCCLVLQLGSCCLFKGASLPTTTASRPCSTPAMHKTYSACCT
jgi:hypothetical protein